MRNNLFFIAFLAFSFSVNAQKYEFQTVIDLETEPVTSQGKSGTCWSFSSTSFLEAEIIRITGKHIDLSEMYNVRETYPKKAWVYIMRQGKAQFSEGGLNHDVINSAKSSGLVPYSVYSGLTNNSKRYDHSVMIAELKIVIEKYADPSLKIGTNWKNEVNEILDKYIGEKVNEFTFEGERYTPKSFLEMTQLKLDDYISLTSFTNEPYYSNFILDIPDNFSNGSFYNLPLNEFVNNIDHALEKGYTIAMDADVSENTFSSEYGIAVIPENLKDEKSILIEIKPEKKITQNLRQQEFENFNTKDDHLMHIVGKVKDQKDNIYYKIKNSWGNNPNYIGHEGYIYMSDSYLKLKVISVLFHKNALLESTKNALKL